MERIPGRPGREEAYGNPAEEIGPAIAAWKEFPCPCPRGPAENGQHLLLRFTREPKFGNRVAQPVKRKPGHVLLRVQGADGARPSQRHRIHDGERGQLYPRSRPEGERPGQVAPGHISGSDPLTVSEGRAAAEPQARPPAGLWPRRDS